MRPRTAARAGVERLSSADVTKALTADAADRRKSRCAAAVVARVRRAEMSVARRAWVRRQGTAPAGTPVWPSREAWIGAVRAWAESPAFGAVCAALRVSMTAATLVAVAVVWAEFADHATGRHAAVTRGRIAARVGCDARTVSRVWKVLGAAGWAVEVARGHGSPATPSVGNRPSIWHLVSPRPQPATTTNSVQFVHLPPSGGSSSLPPVENYSPNAPTGAPDKKSTRNPRRARRSWRTTPRPLALQRLAAQLVACTHGLGHAHLGNMCDALTRSGLDLPAWTAPAIVSALNTDMRATGRCWPDRIERPGAFLAARLRRLPTRPVGDTTPSAGDTAAASPDGNEPPPVSQYAPTPTACDSPRARAWIAAIRARLETASQRRAHTPNDRPAGSGRGRPAVSAPPGPNAGGCCMVCGGADAPRRPYMPVHRAHVCDLCWTNAGVLCR